MNQKPAAVLYQLLLLLCMMASHLMIQMLSVKYGN